jgi:hypothetical protein
MGYNTHSEWLLEQCNDMMVWKARGCQGLDRDACIAQWSEIMRIIEEGNLQVGILKIEENTTISAVLEAAQLCATEGLQHLQEDRASMVDGYRQPEAPWSKRGQRRETEGGFKGDSMEVFKKAERHRPTARTPARHQDSRVITSLLRNRRRRTPRGESRW